MSYNNLQPFTGNYDLTTKKIIDLKRFARVYIIKRLDEETQKIWKEDKVEERLIKYSAVQLSEGGTLESKVKLNKEWVKDIKEHFTLNGDDIKVLEFELGNVLTSGIYSINLTLSILGGNTLTLNLENSNRKYLYWSGKFKGKPIFEPQDIVIVQFNKLKNPNEFKEVFIGFVNSVTASYSDGYHSLVIQAEDIFKILKNTLISSKPGLFPGESFSFPQIYENPFVGKTLTYIVLYLLTWSFAKVNFKPETKNKILRYFEKVDIIGLPKNVTKVTDFIKDFKIVTREIIKDFESQMFNFIRIFDKNGNEVSKDEFEKIKKIILNPKEVLDKRYIFYGYTNEKKIGDPIFECHLSDSLFPYNTALFASSNSLISTFTDVYSQLKTVLDMFNYIMYVNEDSKIIVKPLYYLLDNIQRWEDIEDLYLRLKGDVSETKRRLSRLRPNNIILNEEIISTSYKEDDKDIKTMGYANTEFLAFKGTFNFFPIRYIDIRLAKKFGLRTIQFPSVPGLGDPTNYNKVYEDIYYQLYGKEADESKKYDMVKEVQNYIISRLRRQNLTYRTYDITCIGKPEIELGEALFSEHDYVIGLVSSIQHRFTIGQTFTTSVTLVDVVKPLLKLKEDYWNFKYPRKIVVTQIEEELLKNRIKLTENFYYPNREDPQFKFLLEQYEENLDSLYFDGHIWEIYPEIDFTGNRAILNFKRALKIFKDIIDALKIQLAILKKNLDFNTWLKQFYKSQHFKNEKLPSLYEQIGILRETLLPRLKNITGLNEKDLNKFNIFINLLDKVKSKVDSGKSLETKEINEFKKLANEILNILNRNSLTKFLNTLNYNNK